MLRGRRIGAHRGEMEHKPPPIQTVNHFTLNDKANRNIWIKAGRKAINVLYWPFSFQKDIKLNKHPVWSPLPPNEVLFSFRSRVKHAFIYLPLLVVYLHISAAFRIMRGTQ